MNISGILLANWYYGCALIGVLFVEGMVLCANILNNNGVPETDRKPITFPHPDNIAQAAYNNGMAMANLVHQDGNEQVKQQIIAEYEAQKQTDQQQAAAATNVLQMTPTPPKGS